MRGGLNPKISAAIEESRISVPESLNKERIPGIALALVDDRGTIWTEGFGNTGSNKKAPVNPDTLFPLGDISRLVLATAVMTTVQEGLVHLDEPITTYLPGYRINSRFEDHPERKITLRHLLNCTAGIPDAAPRGNFLEPTTAASFKDHIMSLSKGWLLSPVGGSFHPSTASFELAAYVVSTASNLPYEKFLKEKLFAPLEMNRTTAVQEEIAADTQRAAGSMTGVTQSPNLRAGTLYSTARDMGRLLQLHINRGTVDDRVIIERSLMKIIQTPVGIKQKDPEVYYGQGVFIDKRWPERTETILRQDGWSFGFNSFLHWYPEYGIGMVVLTNRLPSPACVNLGLTLTDKMIKGKFLTKRFPDAAPPSKSIAGLWEGWAGHKPTPYKKEWKRYCGKHNMKVGGFQLEWWLRVAMLVLGKSEYTAYIQVREKDGFLTLTESKLIGRYKKRVVDEQLQEVKPGVFATRTGETLDFSMEFPTWYNFRLQQ